MVKMLKDNKTDDLTESGAALLHAAEKKRIADNEDYESGWERTMRVAAENKTVRCLLSAAAAFLLCGSKIGGAHAPLCVPLASVLDFGGNAAVMAGMLLKSVVMNRVWENLAEIASVVFMMLLKLVVHHRFSVKGSVALSASVYTAAAAAEIFISGADPMAVAAAAFRILICAFGAYVFGRAVSGCTGADPVPKIVCGIILASALCGIQIGYFNVGRIIIGFAAAAGSGKNGCKGGAAAGAAGAMAMMLSDSLFTRAAALTVCAAAASGTASGKGKPAVSLAFIFSSLLLAVTVGLPAGIVEYISDSAVSGILYFIVPEKAYSWFIGGHDRELSGEQRYLSSKMKFSASVIGDIEKDISAARRITAGKEQECDIASAVCRQVCGKCVRAEYCDVYSAANTTAESLCGSVKSSAGASEMMYASKLIRRRGILHENNLPKGFCRCVRKTDVVKSFNREYMAEERRKCSEKVADAICGAALEQMKAQRMTLEEMVLEGFIRDGRLSVTAADIIRSGGINLKAAAVYRDRDGRFYIEAYIAADAEPELSDITEKLSSAVGRTLDRTASAESGFGKNILRCRWCQMPAFIADVGVRSVSGTAELSGDTSDYFSDGFGNMYFIIADGMGSGVRAAEESCMAVSVIRRFIRSGTGAEAAVHYANLLLSGVFSDEMFTTLDIMELNTFTGRCVFYKLGAAESYVRHGGNTEKIECSSLPVGMLPETMINPVHTRLCAGDGAVLVSDGVGSEHSELIREILMNDTVTAELCADKIISASEKKDGERADDRTVIVVRLYNY